MEPFAKLYQSLLAYIPLLAVVAVTIALIAAIQWLLHRRYRNSEEGRFQTQAIVLGLSFAGLLAAVLALPIKDSLRAQLVGLIGILLSGAIALSSTTFLGNAMAGILLRAVRNFRLGDFIEVNGHFGRVSERGLFHTEIQTEDRDLTTLPNLFLVTHPVKVVRASGTIVSATVSLGYDVDRRRVREALLRAASAAGLQDPFVQLTELGDFSVSYRVAGLLGEVKQLLTARSRLRGAMLDELHGDDDGIEIVSPTFMNTRALAATAKIVPPAESESGPAEDEVEMPEELLFDKADKAESVAELNERLAAINRALVKLDELMAAESDEQGRSVLVARKKRLLAGSERVAEALEVARREHEESS